jgi:ribosomal protein S14
MITFLAIRSTSASRLLDPICRIYSVKRVKFSSKSKDYCFVTGRSRGYVSALGVSRLVFKNYCMHAKYTGFKKFVW